MEELNLPQDYRDRFAALRSDLKCCETILTANIEQQKQLRNESECVFAESQNILRNIEALAVNARREMKLSTDWILNIKTGKMQKGWG